MNLFFLNWGVLLFVSKSLIFKSRHKNWKRTNSGQERWLVRVEDKLDKDQRPTPHTYIYILNESIYLSEIGRNQIHFNLYKEHINTKINLKVYQHMNRHHRSKRTFMYDFPLLIFIENIFNRRCGKHQHQENAAQTATANNNNRNKK